MMTGCPTLPKHLRADNRIVVEAIDQPGGICAMIEVVINILS